MLGGLSIAADIAQLTSFNLIGLLNNYSPYSFYLLVILTLLLYFLLVIIEFCNRPVNQSPVPEYKSEQFISTGSVKNSTIIQIKKNKEG